MDQGESEKANQVKNSAGKAVKVDGVTLIIEQVSLPNADALKNIATDYATSLMIYCCWLQKLIRPQVAVMVVAEKLEVRAAKKYHAGNLVKEVSPRN